MKKIVIASLISAAFLSDGFVVLGAAPDMAPSLYRQEQLDQARQREAERNTRLTRPEVNIETIRPKETGSIPESGASFRIDAIQMDGQVEELDFLDEIIAPHVHTEMGLSDVNHLVSALNQKLMDRGYVTSQVVLPEQNIAGGTLRLLLVPGRFHQMVYSEGSDILPWRNAFPLRAGDILNLRQLEQGLEQMKRLRSVDASMKLLPSNIPGMTDVELTIHKGKQLSGNLSVDDSGMEDTGKIQWNIGFGIDRLFNANDTFRFSGNTDGSRDGYAKGTRGESVYYAIPYGKDTWSVQFNHYNSRQTVHSNPYDFISSGKTNLLRFGFDHTISRTATEKRSFDASITRRTSHSFINDLEIPVQAMNSTAFEMGLSDRIYIGNDTLYLRAAQRIGTGWFGAKPDTDYADGPKTHYRMYMADIDYSHPFTMGHRPASYTAFFHGQWTAAGKRLYSVDSLSIGNRYTIWGFDGEYTLMGESGWYLRNELASSIPAIHSQAYFGIDVGAVYGDSTETLVGRTIAGAAIGIRGNFPSGIGYDIFLTRALYKPDGYHTRRWVTGFTLNLAF